MAKQTRQAVAEADAVIFVVDVRGGLSAQDHDIARYLRTQRKRVVLAANKAEGMSESPLLGEFHELGIGEPHPISSAHGQGIRSLIDAALERLPRGRRRRRGRRADDDAPIRLAVAGRPNVGKSTLINAWLGEERLVAFDQPGTTRDAIHVPFERDGRRFELIDTAGLRRKRQGVRGDREVLGRQDAAGDRRRQRRAAADRRDPGRQRPGRAHRRLHPRIAGVRS